MYVDAISGEHVENGREHDSVGKQRLDLAHLEVGH